MHLCVRFSKICSLQTIVSDLSTVNSQHRIAADSPTDMQTAPIVRTNVDWSLAQINKYILRRCLFKWALNRWTVERLNGWTCAGPRLARRGPASCRTRAGLEELADYLNDWMAEWPSTVDCGWTVTHFVLQKKKLY